MIQVCILSHGLQNPDFFSYFNLHFPSDSEKEESTKELKVSVAPKHMTSALGSLMSSYGDMTESENDEEPEGDKKNRIIQVSVNHAINLTLKFLTFAIFVC